MINFLDDVIDTELTDEQMLINHDKAAKLHMNAEDYLSALKELTRCEEIVHQISSKGESPDSDYAFATLYNIGHCYYKMGSIDKAISYLEACLYSSSSPQ